VGHVYYLCPLDPRNPRHQAQAPDHPATVSVREDLLVEMVRRFFATHVFGADRATHLARQLPAGAAEEAAQRDKQATRLRKRLKQIDATEDAHIREVQALSGLDPNSPAVTALRTRHLKRFIELEAERDDINGKIAALAKQATQTTGGDPALLDRLPMLGDLLAKPPTGSSSNCCTPSISKPSTARPRTKSRCGPPSPHQPPPPWPRSSPLVRHLTWPPCSHVSDLASQPGTARIP
jgi:hypothetical protein